MMLTANRKITNPEESVYARYKLSDGVTKVIEMEIFVLGKSYRIVFESDVPLRATGTSLATAGLLPAMTCGKQLIVEHALSTKFLENMNKFQDIYSTWYDTYQKYLS